MSSGLWSDLLDFWYSVTILRIYTPLPTVTSSLLLLDNCFQRWTFPFLWVPELPWPHLPAPHSNSSQWLNHSSPTTNSLTDWLKSQSQSHFTTMGHLANLSWCQAPIWGPRLFITVRQSWVCWHGAPSLMRGQVCHLKLLLALTSSHSFVQVPWDSWPYFTASDSTWWARSPYLIPPRNRVAQVYPQALNSLFVTSYGSQGYGEGIRTHLHTG
jgi:hypothetical protein